MTTRVAIDLNVRVRGQETYAGFEDVDGPLTTGDKVRVYEPETGLTGTGVVTEIDDKHQLVYLAVDWAHLREPVPARDDPPPRPTVWRHFWTAVREAVSATRTPRSRRFAGPLERHRGFGARVRR